MERGRRGERPFERPCDAYDFESVRNALPIALQLRRIVMACQELQTRRDSLRAEREALPEKVRAEAKRSASPAMSESALPRTLEAEHARHANRIRELERDLQTAETDYADKKQTRAKKSVSSFARISLAITWPR